jgi:hypothetical protein
LFKAHDAVYDEENAWIVAVQPESNYLRFRRIARRHAGFEDTTGILADRAE